MTMSLAILLLDGASHDKTSFDCGVERLNLYLRNRAVDYAENDISKTYVATPKAGNEVLGFCAVAANSIQRAELSHAVRRRVGKYEQVPAIIIGQMAVHKARQRGGIGGSLLTYVLRLADALSRKVGIALVILEARNEEVKRFYERYGFRELPRAPLLMFISMREIRSFLTQLVFCPSYIVG